MDAPDRFGSWDGALDLRSPKQASRWVADCEACCFKARLLQKLEAGAEGEYSQGETFWLAADSEPRCMLEQVARSIFAKHAAALGSYDPRRSGAEYWSLCIDADDDDVGLHWDKDFALEAEEGTNLTPAVATVTYLTGQGAPTIMLSRPPPSRLGEPLDDGAPISPSNPDAGPNPDPKPKPSPKPSPKPDPTPSPKLSPSPSPNPNSDPNPSPNPGQARLSRAATSLTRRRASTSPSMAAGSTARQWTSPAAAYVRVSGGSVSRCW